MELCLFGGIQLTLVSIGSGNSLVPSLVPNIQQAINQTKHDPAS